MSTHVVYYSKKSTSANTVYTQISKTDMDLIMSTLKLGLFNLLERSNYDNAAKEFLHQQDETFRKHMNALDAKQSGFPASTGGVYNSLASFLGGLLGQHENVKKDISEKMLQGIHLASRVMQVFNSNSPEIVFVEQKNISSKVPTIFDNLFGVTE